MHVKYFQQHVPFGEHHIEHLRDAWAMRETTESNGIRNLRAESGRSAFHALFFLGPTCRAERSASHTLVLFFGSTELQCGVPKLRGGGDCRTSGGAHRRCRSGPCCCSGTRCRRWKCPGCPPASSRTGALLAHHRPLDRAAASFCGFELLPKLSRHHMLGALCLN